MNNPQTGKIILVDRTEVEADGRGSYLKIYAMGGDTYSIREKRSQLWDLFRKAHQWQPVLAIFETYNNVEYIADARDITDEILKAAIVHLGQRIVDKVADERNRSQSVAYAKDLCVAGKVDIENLFDKAKEIYNFITNRPLDKIEEA